LGFIFSQTLAASSIAYQGFNRGINRLPAFYDLCPFSEHANQSSTKPNKKSNYNKDDGNLY
jgi:hypothetical protein